MQHVIGGSVAVWYFAQGAILICVACGQSTRTDPCGACDQDPTLRGAYRLSQVLGRGGSGTAFRAETVANGPDLCVKETVLTGSSPQKARDLAAREARVLGELDHFGVPRWIDSFATYNGRTQSLWLVEELIEGRDLREEMQHHRFSEDEVIRIAQGLLLVLEYLHTLSPPVIHRDIKPANVILRQDGRVVLVDFGSVRDVLRDPQLGGSTVTGTFGYMAPEQFSGDASQTTDLYGLGALMIALLTRKEPRELLGPTRRLEWRSRCAIRPALALWIDAMVSIEPADRPVSARAALDLLNDVRVGSPLILRPLPLTRQEPGSAEHDGRSEWLSPLLARMHSLREDEVESASYRVDQTPAYGSAFVAPSRKEVLYLVLRASLMVLLVASGVGVALATLVAVMRFLAL